MLPFRQVVRNEVRVRIQEQALMVEEKRSIEHRQLEVLCSMLKAGQSGPSSER